jgi:hypothetical protein
MKIRFQFPNLPQKIIITTNRGVKSVNYTNKLIFLIFFDGDYINSFKEAVKCHLPLRKDTV